jgi:hypothetical protein
MRAPALARLALVGAVSILSLGAQPAPEYRGPYLGQPPPGATPALFAPGFVNAGLPTRDAAFTPDGKELYFSVFVPGFLHAAILVTRSTDNAWTRPEVAPFSSDSRYRSIEPCISLDGKRLFFASNRPADPTATQPGPFAIWVMEREASGWSAPRRLGPTVNGEGEAYFPSLTRDGTLYFTREGKDGVSTIYRARQRDGDYLAAERLPDAVNLGTTRFNAFVAPDESYVIVPAYGRADSLGGVDYYIVFRQAPDAWSEPQNLGPTINSGGGDEYSPHVTRDGRYFFFMANRGEKPSIAASEPLSLGRLLDVTRTAATQFPSLYWIDAGFIEKLRATAVFR